MKRIDFRTDIGLSGEPPFLVVGVIDRLAQVTIIKVNRMSLTHPGFRRVLIQCAVLGKMSLCIASGDGRQ